MVAAAGDDQGVGRCQVKYGRAELSAVETHATPNAGFKTMGTQTQVQNGIETRMCSGRPDLRDS